MSRYIYITIETKTRELDAKILLSMEAAKNGYISIIGRKELLHKLSYFPFPKGIYFYKDSYPAVENIFKNIKKCGHKIIVHHEEGYVQFNWKNYLDTCIAFNTLKYIDKYLCWGKEQANAIESIKNSINTSLIVKITGHPRIDLLRKKIKNYNKIKIKNNKKTILINTKFGTSNFKNTSTTWLEKQYKERTYLSDIEKKDLQKMVNYYTELLSYYTKLISEMILKFSECRIIIRPHPVENIEFWIERYAKYENVEVTNEFPIGYWIHQADIIIHTGCTTAIEGFIMGVPAISYKPIENRAFSIPLPDSISFIAKTQQVCLDKINTILNNKYDRNSYFSKGRKILSNYLDISEDELSTKKIIKELNEYKFKNINNSFISKIQIKFGFFILEKLVNIKTSLLKKRHIVEDLTEVEIKEKIEKFKSVTSDNTNYIVTKIATNTISVTIK